MNLEQRLHSLELQADATLSTKDIITVIVTPETIELHSDVFGQEIHDRNNMSLQDIKDELSFRFSDSEDTHFVYLINRDYESTRN